MKIIGLTGGSGSGKGMVGRLMSAFGCRVIDTDALYHNMISSSGPCSEALIERFGTEISTENGGICRPKLSSIVFSDRAALDDLNKIAHAFVREECQRIIDNEQTNGTEVLVIDAPQLFEAGMQDICDMTVAVISDRDKRIRRICNRDRITPEKAIARINAQRTDEFFSESCDYVIVNNTDMARLLVRVKTLLDEIKDKR